MTVGAKDKISLKHYVSCAFTYLTAMVASNMALQHVNYPTQVIGKSSKSIPVMVLGVLYGRKSYPLKKYFFILMIVCGVALFVWKDGRSTSNDSSQVSGYVLLMLSLAMDGFTGAIQDRIRSENQVRFAPLMYNVNMWASIMLGSATLATGELATFVEFLKKYPTVMQDIMWFSVLSALGQVRVLEETSRLLTPVLLAVHIPDGGRLWPSSLRHRHDDQKVLYGSSVYPVLWEHGYLQTAAWDHSRLFRPSFGLVEGQAVVRQEAGEDGSV